MPGLEERLHVRDALISDQINLISRISTRSCIFDKSTMRISSGYASASHISLRCCCISACASRLICHDCKYVIAICASRSLCQQILHLWFGSYRIITTTYYPACASRLGHKVAIPYQDYLRIKMLRADQADHAINLLSLTTSGLRAAFVLSMLSHCHRIANAIALERYLSHARLVRLLLTLFASTSPKPRMKSLARAKSSRAWEYLVSYSSCNYVFYIFLRSKKMVIRVYLGSTEGLIAKLLILRILTK